MQLHAFIIHKNKEKQLQFHLNVTDAAPAAENCVHLNHMGASPSELERRVDAGDADAMLQLALSQC